MQSQLEGDTGNNLMMSSYVLQGQVKATTSSNNMFLKHDADDSDASDQEDEEMFRRMTETQQRNKARVAACQSGANALDLSLTRQCVDDDDDDVDFGDDDDCEDRDEPSTYLQTLQTLPRSNIRRGMKEKSSVLNHSSSGDNLLHLQSDLGQTSFMDRSRGVWHHESDTSANPSLNHSWHLPINGATNGLVGGGDIDLLGGSSPLADEWAADNKELTQAMVDGRMRGNTSPWSLVHDPQSQHPLLHWGGSSTGSPVVHMVQPAGSDTDLLASQSMTSCHEFSLAEKSSTLHQTTITGADWRKQQSHNNHQDVNAWHKNMAGEVFSQDLQSHQPLFPAQSINAPSFSVVNPEKWHYEANPDQNSDSVSQQEASLLRNNACPGTQNASSSHSSHATHISHTTHGAAHGAAHGSHSALGIHGHHATPTPHGLHHAAHRPHGGFFQHSLAEYQQLQRQSNREPWPPAGHHHHISVLSRGRTDRPPLKGLPPVLSTSAIEHPRAKSCKADLPIGQIGSPKVRPTNKLQVRKQSHPYQLKEQKAMVRDVYSTPSTNVQTLKASHIVSWYIDYLIHENEDVTQISRAFSLPVNLYQSPDFYFMDSLKKKVHFPSLKFMSWMHQNLPSINVNAVDFHEGRVPVSGRWNQDRFWDTRSSRDIIHDVFYFFQRQQHEQHQQQQLMI